MPEVAPSSLARPLTRRSVLKGGASLALGTGLAGSLFACGGSAKTKSNELTFWTISYFNGRTGKEPNGKPGDYYNWQIAQFREEYPNVDIKVQLIPSTFEGWAKFDTAVAAGRAPDVMWGQAGNQWRYAPQNAIETFDGRMPGDVADDLLPSLGPLITYADKKTYLWPYGVAVAGGVFINTDVARKAGAGDLVPTGDEREWTTDDVVALAKATTGTIDGKQVYGTGLMTDWSYQLNQFLYAFGAELYNEQQTEMTANSPEGTQGLQWLVDLLGEKVVAPGAVGGENEQVLRMFLQQQIAIYPAQPYYITAFREQPKLKPKFEWTFVKPPHSGSNASGAEANVHGYLVSKQDDTDKLELAMRFVEFLTRREALEILANGQGVIPPQQKMLDIVADDPDRSIEAAIAENARPWGRLYEQIGPKVLTPMYDSALSGDASPEDALGTAVEAGNEIIERTAQRYKWDTAA